MAKTAFTAVYDDSDDVENNQAPFERCRMYTCTLACCLKHLGSCDGDIPAARNADMDVSVDRFKT